MTKPESTNTNTPSCYVGRRPKSPIATRQRPIIRVFVSSTFSDLKLERDALQRRVYPKLEQRCLQDGFQFHAIDLRWGVSTEAGLDHRTMRICFEELRRSQEVSPQPNFLILIGNRYGWRPLPEEISGEEFCWLEKAAGQIGVSEEQPSPVEVLRRWYRLDKNSLAPVYILQPRRKSQEGDPGGRDFTKPEVWEGVEQVLWRIINRAFPPSGLKDRFDLSAPSNGTLPRVVRFQASATEQEIWNALFSAPDASEHVLAFFRELNQPTNGEDVTRIRKFFDVSSDRINSEAQAALRELKDEIKKQLGNNAVVLPTARLVLPNTPNTPNGITTVSTNHIDELCREVESRLSEIIEQQIGEWRKPRTTPYATNRELEIEHDEHVRFAEERAENFIGRDEPGGPLERIHDYIKGDSRVPLVIHGPSGSGKTALLARAFQKIQEKNKPIIRFIGATPRASALRLLLSDLCLEMREENRIAEILPEEVPDLQREFLQHLNAASKERPVVLLLDALDQLSDANGGRSLQWLPGSPSDLLPDHVKVIVSCLSDRDEKDPAGKSFAILQRRKLVDRDAELNALSREDASTLLFDRWLKSSGRTFDGEDSNKKAQLRLIEERLQSGEQCRQPLYLKLLFEEVKLWRSWDKPPLPGSSVEELLEQLVARISDEVNHGPLLVARALGYIAAARRGLSETEILEVLFADDADDGYKTRLHIESARTNHTLPTEPPRIPVAIWSRLRSDLAPHLTERTVLGGTVLTFYHRQVADWLKARFVDEANWFPYRSLADFFSSQRPNLRQVDELPWQMAQARFWQSLSHLLSDPKFFHALWQLNQFDARQYWTSLEKEAGINIENAYREVLDAPASYEPYLWDIAMLLCDTGHLEAAAVLWQHLISSIRCTGNLGRLHGALSNYAKILRSWGDKKKALEALKEVELISRDLKDNRLLCIALDGQATILHSRGDVENALRLIDEEIELCRELGDDGMLAVPLGNKAAFLASKGNVDEALTLLRETERLALASGDQDHVANSLANQAVLLASHGEVSESLATLERVADIHQKLGNRDALQGVLGQQANLLFSSGEVTRALDLWDKQEQLCREIGKPNDLCDCLFNQAKTLAVESDPYSAIAKCDEILRVIFEEERKGDVPAQLLHMSVNAKTLKFHATELLELWLVEQASNYIAEGDTEAAKEFVSKAEPVARELGHVVNLAKSIGRLAMEANNHGDRGAAIMLWRKVEQLAQEGNDQAGMEVAWDCQRALNFEEGDELAAKGEVMAALKCYEESARASRNLKDDDGNWKALYMLALTCLDHDQQFEKALAACDEAIRVLESCGDSGDFLVGARTMRASIEEKLLCNR